MKIEDVITFPIRVDEAGYFWDAENNMVAQTRGFGKYQYESDGMQKMDFISKWIEEKLNSRADGWIKCSDRLPQEVGRYSCTVLFKEQPSVHELSFHKTAWLTLTWKPIPLNQVVAWRELPEPFTD